LLVVLWHALSWSGYDAEDQGGGREVCKGLLGKGRKFLIRGYRQRSTPR